MTPPRLLIVTTDLQIGGTPTVVRELAVRLGGRGHEVEVASLGDRGPVGAELMAAGVTVHALGARGRWDAWVIERLARLIRFRGYSAVYSLLMHANVAAAGARVLLGRAAREIVWTQSIQTTQPTPRWHWHAQWAAAWGARRVIVPTPSVTRAAGEWAGVDMGKVAVIPNAIEPGEFEIARTAAARCRVGFVGRLDPVKRVGDLIDAVRTLPAEGFELHIYGDGPQRRELEARAAGAAVFHGAAPRAAGVLGAIDVLVLCSAAEGFGLVLIEAMAAGVPVVATDVAGIRDVVEAGVSGLLVPMGDVGAIAGAIRRIAGDAALAARLVAGGRARVAAMYTWGAVLPRYEIELGLVT